MIDSERLDLESASSAYRRRRCPGSANLVRALREAGKVMEREDPLAQSGTRVHRAWCGLPVSDLTAREADTLESLKRMEALVVTDWAAGEEFALLGREQRLWLHERLVPIHSGAFDVAYGTVGAAQGRMLIIDGKTLFGEVSAAEENDQLRELVALARANFPNCFEFTVAILQPWVSKRASVAVYDEPEAELALRELRATIRDCADPDAPRIAGVWCDKCPAFDLCDEPRRLTARTQNLARDIAQGAFSLPIGEDGARLLDAVKLAQGYLRVVLDRYKVLLAQAPGCVPGWQLKDGKRVRVIGDVGAALKLASEFMSWEQFFAATTVNIARLAEACSANNGGLRGKALEDWFNTRFADVLSFEQYAPELARENAKSRRLKEGAK